jgi:transposase
MERHKQAVRKTIRAVINGRLTPKDAAKVLRVSVRTVRNYATKFLDQGPEGLLDHRRGHFRKIEREQEIRIVACKLDGPGRSARWIRDRLKLPVSVEAVRQVLLKHHLNRISLQPRSGLSTTSYKWDPF